jgi:hypothetical protein
VIKFVSRLNLSGTRVDRESGVIKGVSLIALGDARGHDKAVDQKTLESVRDCARQYTDGLRVKFNPNTFTHGVGTLAGYIPADTIHVKGGKTIGDLHLYNKMPQDIKEFLFELAEETPGNIGLSIEFSGDDEEVGGNKFARCSEIFAATIVDLPAANPTGLFSSEDNNRNANSDKDTSMNDEQLTKLTSTITASLKAGFSEIKQMFADNPFPPKEKEKTDEEKAKEEMAAAGITELDDEEAKQTKLATYRASQSKPVGQMSAAELGAVIAKSQMQFFRETGGKAAKVTVENDKETLDPFERRVKQHMEAGARSRGIAIMRARRDSGAEYNAWRAKQNPNVQHMSRK